MRSARAKVDLPCNGYNTLKESLSSLHSIPHRTHAGSQFRSDARASLQFGTSATRPQILAIFIRSLLCCCSCCGCFYCHCCCSQLLLQLLRLFPEMHVVVVVVVRCDAPFVICICAVRCVMATLRWFLPACSTVVALAIHPLVLLLLLQNMQSTPKHVMGLWRHGAGESTAILCNNLLLDGNCFELIAVVVRILGHWVGGCIYDYNKTRTRVQSMWILRNGETAAASNDLITSAKYIPQHSMDSPQFLH